MKKKTFRIVTVVVTVLIAAAMAAGVIMKNLFVGIFTFIAGFAILMILNPMVKEVVKDERNVQIAEKSYSLTFRIIAVYLGIGIPAATIAAQQMRLDWLMNVTNAIAYTVAIPMVVLSLLLRFIYSRKFGTGKNDAQ